MARKIFVFFLLLLTGTFMAWGEAGPTNRTNGDETSRTLEQLPSVMRRSSARTARNLDRPTVSPTAAPPADEVGGAPDQALDQAPDQAPDQAMEEAAVEAPVNETSAPAGAPPAPRSNFAAPPAGSAVDPSALPTVMRRKPRQAVESPDSPPAESSDAAPSAPRSNVEFQAPNRGGSSLPRPFGPASSRSAPPANRVPAAGGTVPAAVLLQGNTPGLRVEASGPRNMRRGVAGKYVVNVTNTSEQSFENLEVRLSLPNSVALTGSEVSSGESRRVEDTDELGAVVWTLPRVDPRTREQMVVQLVPHHDRPFEVGLDWVCRSARQVATIEVQQPQLELSMSGQKDARFGDAVDYLVTVSNPGTGDAENVVVKLQAGQNAPESVTVGAVAAGQQKQIEVQLAANQPGELKLVAEATADGDLRAEAFAEILVRKAELQAQVVGPKTKFAGVPSLYQVQVVNGGNAPADDVAVTLILPPGVRVESATEGARQTANSLVWRIGSLAAAAERVFEVRCELTTTGENKVEARVAAADGQAVAANATTVVEALADLKLNVTEPKGPRQVGDELVYEIVVGNRGTKAAEEVNVVFQFADGIEPLGAEGSPAEIVDGQVVFEPVARLAAGQQVTLRVRARAEKSGGQRFRAEVQCPASDTQLVSEGTTRIFGDDTVVGSNPEPRATPRR